MPSSGSREPTIHQFGRFWGNTIINRIMLFPAAQLAIVLVLFGISRVPGIDPHLNLLGPDLHLLFIFAAAIGFGDALVRLANAKCSARIAVRS